ncbi:hypothetical protein BCV72DRAFT_246862 [Rhizopus microsporus var. microsporus]|uniref:Uncharacterized protein n=1 Tax=Rhizopus microsporus var. microsporus TaxID=86635 RepID=A0A1X0RHU1_RHIZD|nr:hypothetical protein BCV72DRAFT_246862 [Rhizopus microsporus var. microsporus]
MSKVLKEMMCALHKKSPDALRESTFVGFLLFDTKFTMILCDLPTSYVCRINHTKTVDLPKEANAICNELSILKAVYQIMDVNIDLEQYKIILPSLTTEGSKRKRRRNGDPTKE